MACPKYDPKSWNKRKVRVINNCYNYATNKMFEPDDKNQALPGPAQPGRSKKMSLGVAKPGLFDARAAQKIFSKTGLLVGVLPASDFSCDTIAAACSLDGLKQVKELTCEDSDCCVVAAYHRPLSKTKDVFALSADFHFVRLDSDGKYSHKPGFGSGSKVTRSQYNPAKKDYSGPPITNPEKDNVGNGYKFCGYFCVCPQNITIASADIVDTGSGTRTALLARADSHAFASAFAMLAGGTDDDFVSITNQMADAVGGNWKKGFGGGELRYRLDLGGDSRAAAFTLLVTDCSMTIWDGKPGYLNDSLGIAEARFDELLGSTNQERIDNPERPKKPEMKLVLRT